jgi:hemolysin activation/secretion protein
MTISRARTETGHEILRNPATVIIVHALALAFAPASAGASGAADATGTARRRTTIATPAASAGLATSNLAAATLTTVIVDGATVYTIPQLFPAYRDQLGNSLSRDGARSVASAISAALGERYVADGYVKPEVRVDDAAAARGILRVRVHEARVSRVVFDGKPGRHAAALARIAAKLEAARPLRQDDVPRTLREMRAIPGLAVTATTRRDATTRNAFELVVKTDFSPIDGVVRTNNRGTDAVGPHFLLGQVFVNGPFGGQEKLGLVFAAATDTEEYLGGGLYFDTPVGDDGTRASSLLFRSRSAPTEAPMNLDDEYTRERATLKLSRPLWQTPTLTLTLSGGFEADDLVIDRAGAAIREDRLRIAETGLRASWRSAGGMQYSTQLLVRQGFDDFGAGLQAPGLGDDPRRADFVVAQLQSSVIRRFAGTWSLRFDGFAQHSGYVLPDSERFKIGGDRLGRGFEVAEIAGDRGVGGKLELRRDVLNTETLVGGVSAYGFYDIGAAWKQDRPGRESAATAGTGLSMGGSSLTGYLEVAAPLTGTDVEGKRRMSVFAEISYRF